MLIVTLYAITTPLVTSAVTHDVLVLILCCNQTRISEWGGDCEQISRNCGSGKCVSVEHVALWFDKGWLLCNNCVLRGQYQDRHTSLHQLHPAELHKPLACEASRKTHLVALPASVWRSLYCVFGLLKPFRRTLSYTWKTRRRRVSTSNPVFECGTVCSELLKIIVCCALIMVFEGRGLVKMATLRPMLLAAGGDAPICTVRRRA